MASPLLWADRQRAARFETFEERLALSADSLSDVLEGFGERLEHHYGEIAPALADMDKTNGVRYVRDTYGMDGSGQTVAVIDSGVAYDHLALGAGFGAAYRVVGGWDFAEGDGNPYDDAPGGFHGTHVAGIIGSSDGTYSGVAPGVDLVALRVFDDQGLGYLEWVESALQWVHDNRDAFENPITTVNLSLGTDWNAGRVPDWTTLENEFAQLEADGMFIAVSAGNSFQESGATGLSYPAASPYVVPVASVDNNGLLSDFSQRDDRVLAAPGRLVTSTVPDFVYGGDGDYNDFGAATGTSMAAPYVAGASVLVREAMESLGFASITQEVIYDHLRATADPIYDTATGGVYHRVNVQAALAGLVPHDEYGSTIDTAYSLGTLSSETTIVGMINTLDDRDYLTFTAGQTGSATLSVRGDATWRPHVSLVEGTAMHVDGVWTFDVVAGQRYTLQLTEAAGIGSYELGIRLDASMVDLGEVHFQQLVGQSASDDAWYQFAATRDGILTVEALTDRAAGDAGWQLYDEQYEMLAVGDSAGTHRVDVLTTAGERFYLKISGGDNEFDLRLANVVGVRGATWDVFGTAGDDTIVFRAGDSSVSLNGLRYADDAISVIRIFAGAGDDTATVYGTDGRDQATLQVGQVKVNGDGYELEVFDAEGIRVDAAGGHDVVFVYDSAGDDTLEADRDRLSIKGSGFENEARRFERAYAYARGGQDIAKLFDSAGNDTLSSRSDRTSFSGSGYFNQVQGFDRVYAYAIRGGYDVARLYDSAGNDTFFADNVSTSISGDGFYNYAQHFDRVYAYATRGGYDVARLYDSAGNDTFFASSTSVSLSGHGFYNHAQQFERVDAYATRGGYDIARLHDSAGDDTFRVDNFSASLSGRGFYNFAQHFDRVDAYATRGGFDVARFYDSAGDDTFFADNFSASLRGAGFHNSAQQFDQVYAYATRGGYDTAHLYDSAGDDTFHAEGHLAILGGAEYRNTAQQFDRIYAYATRGGDDMARLDAWTQGSISLVGGFLMAETTNHAATSPRSSVPQASAASQRISQAVFQDLERVGALLTVNRLSQLQSTPFSTSGRVTESWWSILQRSPIDKDDTCEVDWYFAGLGQEGIA